MSKTEIEVKIQELETCLKNNPDHPNRILIETDLRDLKTKLAEDYD